MTQTNMMNGKRNLLFGSTPKNVVDMFLSCLGNTSLSNGVWNHSLLAVWTTTWRSHFPDWLTQSISDFVFFNVHGFKRNSKTCFDEDLKSKGDDTGKGFFKRKLSDMLTEESTKEIITRGKKED